MLNPPADHNRGIRVTQDKLRHNRDTGVAPNQPDQFFSCHFMDLATFKDSHFILQFIMILDSESTEKHRSKKEEGDPSKML